MKQYDRTNVKPAMGESEQLPAGGYVLTITECVDDEENERLQVEYDIAEGPHKGFFADIYSRTGYWRGKTIKSYKEKAQRFFEAFLQAVEKSNPGYQWDWKPESLVGKAVGAVMREEEYVGTDRESGKKVVRVRVTPDHFKPAEDIRGGKFKVRDRKPLKPEQRDEVAGFEDVSDDEVPFE